MNEKLNELNEWARLIVSAMIMGYFGYAVFSHWSEGIEETLKNTFMIAVGYWLGSSKGSSDKWKKMEAHGPWPLDDIK